MKVRNWSIAAVAILAAGASADAATFYSTSFEAPTYPAGSSVHGIDGWNNASGSGASQTVSTDVAWHGSQSLQFNNTSLLSFYSVRRAMPAYQPDAFSASVKLYIDGSTQDNRLYGLYLTSGATSTLGGTVLGLTIGGDGAVRAGKTWSMTYGNPGLIGFADPGTYLDRWLTIDLTFDPATAIGTASISGFAGPNPSISQSFTAVTAPLGLNLGSDYFATSNHAGIGYFDSLVIAALPSPGALALLGLAGLLGVHRRRA
jgi:hypothetical protein